MAIPFSLTLRLRSLGNTALATAGLAKWVLAPMSHGLREKGLRVTSSGGGGAGGGGGGGGGGGAGFIHDTTPVGSEEAVLGTYPSTERATYSFTKLGFVQTTATTMPVTGEPVSYFPEIVDARGEAGFPADFALFSSTDHSTADGGIFMSVCRGDPSVLSNWLTYDAALAAGWFNSVATKPAANPVFNLPGAGCQVETPAIIKVAGKWLMFYQRGNASAPYALTNAGNQGTCTATSTDLLNWLTTNQMTLGLAEIPISEAPGDRHTGYMGCALNTAFTGVPYAYIGSSLIGGQSRSTGAIWGSNNPDPTNGGGWTFITAMNKHAGRAKDGISGISPDPGFSIINIDWKSQRATPQGVSVLMECAALGSGSVTRDGDIFEVILSTDAKRVVRKPVKVISRGTTGAFDAGEIARSSSLIYGNQRLTFYTGVNSSGVNSVGVATSPLLNPLNTFHDALSPPIPSDVVTTADLDLTGLSSRPAGWTKVGTVTETYGSGINVALTGAADEFYLFNDDGFVAQQTDFVDLYWKDWVTPSGNSYRIPYIGFVDAKDVRANWQNGFFISNDEIGTAPEMTYNRLVGGTKTSNQTSFYYSMGYGTQTTSRSKKMVGVRWWPNSNRVIALGEGGVEMEDFPSASGMDLTKTYYAVIGFKGTAGGVANERVGGIRFRQKETISVAPSVPVTVSKTDQKVSASNASAYTFTAAALGTAATGRRIVVDVTGRATVDSSPLTVTCGGVAMTKIGEMVTTQDTGASNSFVKRFILQVDAGTTADIVIGGGVAMVRCGINVFRLMNIASNTPVTVSGRQGNTTGTSPAHTIPKINGGGLIATANYCTTGSTYISGATEEMAVSTGGSSITFANSSATPNWTGIANPDAGLLVEAGGSTYSATLVSTWAAAS